MKKIVFFIGITAMLFFLCGTARANSKDFGDTTKYWPDYPSSTTSENGLDVIGIPDITGGTVEYTPTTNILEKITMDYSEDSTYWSYLIPGDLFIDINNDKDWEYIVKSSGTQATGTWDVYSVPTGVPVSYEKTSATDPGGFPSGFDIRNSHPFAADAATLSNLDKLTPTVYFDGWTTPGTTGRTTYWDFTSLSIALGQTFAIGYTVNCANDVIYEVITLPQGFDTVPVPGAIWLLGSGLLALVGLRRKSRNFIRGGRN